MGLLNYLTLHSLDEDYAHASRQRTGRGEPRQIRPGMAALVILAMFGLLLTVAGVQTSRNAPDSELGHASLVKQVRERQAQLRSRRDQTSALRADIESLQADYRQVTVEGASMQTRLSRLGVATGAIAVRGPGAKVVVDDSPVATSGKQRVQDKDLRILVNGLWLAGAEAISINGERLSTLSAIRFAGTAITVNFTSLVRPYVVSAVGNPDQLPARFAETQSGSYWSDVQRNYGLQFTMTPEESLKLPAATKLTLRQARVPATPKMAR